MKVSILMAVYNGEKYINEMIESILNQTYTDFICYIHDDGSTDNTLKICQKYSKMYPDKIVLMNYKPTGSACKNFISMLKYASETELIMFCDQDDVWLPTKIEETLQLYKLEYNNIPTLIYSDLKIVNSQLEVIADSYLSFCNKLNIEPSLKNIAFEGYIPGCTIMINNMAKEKILEFQNINNIYMHDWWAMQVVLALGGKIIRQDKQLMLYRQHENNCVGTNKISLKNKVLNNLKKIFNKTLSEYKRNRINRALRQLNELKNISGLKKSTIEFLNDIEKIQQQNKLVRIFKYWKIFKNTPNIFGIIFWM